jgi:REP element-mobilizing transposase RayT
MANTYTQLNIHAVFAVQGRYNILSKEIRPHIFEYISGIIKGIGLCPLAVNGFSDHIHVFFEIKPDMSVSKAIQEIKANSSKWINEQGFIRRKFKWQSGYGAFSYSRSQRNNVIQYIMNQEIHHYKTTFRKEYMAFLTKFNIKFNEEYVFEFYD